MAEPPVVNASPLIFLAGGDCFEFLQVAGETVQVPSTVASEIRRRGAADPTVQAIERTDWLSVVDDVPVPGLIQSWDLGPGESAVLALAHANPSTEAIIDDLAARRCAAALGIPVRGTLSLVLGAKQRGLITAARPVLNRMVQAGMYLSDRLLNEALALVGESCDGSFGSRKAILPAHLNGAINYRMLDRGFWT